MRQVTINNRECFKFELPYSKQSVYIKCRLKGRDIEMIQQSTLSNEPSLYSTRFAIEAIGDEEKQGELTIDLMRDMDSEDLEFLSEQVNAIHNAEEEPEDLKEAKKK